MNSQLINDNPATPCTVINVTADVIESSASCNHQTQPVTLTMTKIKVVTVPVSMLPRPKQIGSSDLKFDTCVDELVPALRAEIKKANGDSDKIIEWQQKEIKRYEEKAL